MVMQSVEVSHRIARRNSSEPYSAKGLRVIGVKE